MRYHFSLNKARLRLALKEPSYSISIHDMLAKMLFSGIRDNSYVPCLWLQTLSSQEKIAVAAANMSFVLSVSQG